MIKRFMLSAGILLAMNSYGQNTSTDPLVPGGTPSNKSDASGARTSSSSLYNVNMYDGTASINVPIFDYSIAGLNLGISLNYDTHGIRVDDIAGPTGLGWNLSAGGSITRQVNGIEDELTTKEWNDDVSGRWMATVSELSRRDKQSDVFSASFAGRSIRFGWGSPNTMKFVTYPASNIKVNIYLEDLPPAQRLRGFSWNDTSIDKSRDKNLLCFEITDESNNVFFFRPGNRKFKIPDSTTHGIYPKTSGGPDQWIPETWDLVRIITKYRDTINYTYGYFKDAEYPQYKDEQLRINYEPLYINSTGGYEPVGLTVRKNEVVKWKGDISYLTRIDYPNGIKVLFDMSLDRLDRMPLKALNKITIEHELDNNIKNSYGFKFNYAYFHTPYSNFNDVEIPYDNSVPTQYLLNLNKYISNGLTLEQAIYQVSTGFRLKLQGISKFGKDNVTEPYFAFNYNYIPLPNRLSPSKDFYGYANGQQSVYVKTNTYPYTFPERPDLYGLSVNKNTYTISSGSITYGVDKTPNFSFAKAAILEKITNAGGGTINFYYKEHELTNPANGLVGSSYASTYMTRTPEIISSSDIEGKDANDGLCIESIVINDGVNPDNVITEKYVYSEGQRFYPGSHSSYPVSMDYYNRSIKTRDFFNSFIAPMPMVNGSNHGYTYAEVKKYGYNNAFLGSTKHHFTNLIVKDDAPAQSNLEFFHSSNDPRPPYNNYYTYDFDHAGFYAMPPEVIYEYRMGKILETFNYDQANTLTDKTTYTYQDYLQLPATSFYDYGLVNNVNTPTGSNRAYWPFLGVPFLMTNKTSTVMTSAGNITTSIDYSYDNQYNLYRTRTLDHLGRRTTELNLNTYYSGGTNYEGKMISGYSGSNHLDHWTFPLGTKLFKTINGNEYCISSTRIEYKDYPVYLPGHLNPILVPKPSKNYIQYADEPVLLADFPANEEPVNEITRYDSRNNIIEVKYEDKEFYACSVWDTRIGRKIAAVRNARYDEIAYTSFEGTNFLPYNTADDNKGNWNFKPDGVVYKPEMTVNGAVTGKYYFGLNWSNPIDALNPTVSGKKYVLTFWATAKPFVNAGNDFYGLTQQMQVGNWKMYTTSFTGNGSPVRIWSNTPVDLDELRMYPADATMTTTTYEPLYGPSSVCDDRGGISYMEYDAMGRQTTTRDINRNILSVTQTVISSNTDN